MMFTNTAFHTASMWEALNKFTHHDLDIKHMSAQSDRAEFHRYRYFHTIKA